MCQYKCGEIQKIEYREDDQSLQMTIKMINEFAIAKPNISTDTPLTDFDTLQQDILLLQIVETLLN